MLFLLFLCSCLVSYTGALQCFFPDGNVTSTDIACQPNAASSACCGEGGTCYSNGLCEYTDSLANGSVVKDYQRASCTDRTWAATECFHQCLLPWHAGSEAVRPCEGISTGLKYCCALGLESNGLDDYSCCLTASNVFTIASIPTPVAIIANGTAMAIAIKSSPAVVISAPTTSSSEPATGGGSSGYSVSEKIALGCGIGIGLPATIATLFSVWLTLRRRERIRSLTSVVGRSRPSPVQRSVQPYTHRPIRSPVHRGHGTPF